MFWIGDEITESRLHAPNAEHGVAVDAVLLLDPLKQRRVFRRAPLSRLDPPAGHTLVEILPDFFVEFRLIAIERVDGKIGLQRAHDAVVSGTGDALGLSPSAEGRNPLREG